MSTDITIIIPVKNEMVHIERCIRSVRDLGRVVVVDAESTDTTVQLARDEGADVLVHAWSGYAEQKNWALDNAGVDTAWVLLMDADEFLSDAATRAIREAVHAEHIAGYWLPRRYVFLGRELRYSWWYPDFQLRLVRAGAGRFEPRSVHEHMEVEGEVAYLWADIWHENLKGLGAFVDRHNRYASLEAGELSKPSSGIRAGRWLGDWAERRRALKVRVWMRLPGRPLVRFLWLYVVRLGFRDGREGLYFCALIAWYDLLINVKALEGRVERDEQARSRYDVGSPHPRARGGHRDGPAELGESSRGRP